MSRISPQESSPQGLLLVGHGTRDPRGLGEFRQLADKVKELASDFLVEACFLELAEPDIASGVRRLLGREIGRLTVAPVLLFAAGHAKRDIPAAVEEAVGGRDYAVGGRQMAEDGTAAIKVVQCAALECHPKIVELSARRYAEALNGRGDVDAAETLLVLVARGSSEASAIAEMQRFTALRGERTAAARAECCFAAVATPTMSEVFDRAAGEAFKRIVVQPHLLFTGQVLDQIAAAVATVSKRRPDQEWIVTSHLGPSPLVGEALVDLARRGCA